MRLGAKSYMRKGFLKYEEMRKYLVLYEEAVSHIRFCTRSRLNFLMYKKNMIFFFISAAMISSQIRRFFRIDRVQNHT
jgi:hypothetical protein